MCMGELRGHTGGGATARGKPLSDQADRHRRRRTDARALGGAQARQDGQHFGALAAIERQVCLAVRRGHLCGSSGGRSGFDGCSSLQNTCRRQRAAAAAVEHSSMRPSAQPSAAHLDERDVGAGGPRLVTPHVAFHAAGSRLVAGEKRQREERPASVSWQLESSRACPMQAPHGCGISPAGRHPTRPRTCIVILLAHGLT